MPARDLTINQWKILRKLLRTKKPVSGVALEKLVYIRKQHRARVFKDLTASGLVTVTPAAAPNPNLPEYANAEYALTNAGKVAAEYGVYEYEVVRDRKNPDVILGYKATEVQPIPTDS